MSAYPEPWLKYYLIVLNVHTVTISTLKLQNSHIS